MSTPIPKSLALLSLFALVAIPLMASATTYNPPITINNPTPVAGDVFGYSVAIDGDKFVVGAPYDDHTGVHDVGSAYIYDTTTGALLHTLSNPTPAENDWFGISVSISGDKVLIGARLDDTGATDAGSAYLFDATTGALLHTFNNPTPAQNDYFGLFLSLSGDKALISAHWDNTGATNAGSAYLYDVTTGTLLQTFNNPTPAVNDHFGYSVSISGDKVLVGAYRDDTGATDAGSAYLFDATTGALLHTFNNPTPAVNDHFGYSVSISDNKAVIGNIPGLRSAHLYDTTTSALLQTFNYPAPVESVSISSDKILIGAPWDNTGATSAGSVYLYLPQTDTDGDGIIDSADNCPADVNADQADTDGDGEGNVCDFTPNGDTDGDGVDNLADNCPGIANPGQEDNDADGLGNVCDPTPDGDPNPNPTSINQCQQLYWMGFSFRNQGQCVAFVNTGHDSR